MLSEARQQPERVNKPRIRRSSVWWAGSLHPSAVLYQWILKKNRTNGENLSPNSSLARESSMVPHLATMERWHVLFRTWTPQKREGASVGKRESVSCKTREESDIKDHLIVFGHMLMRERDKASLQPRETFPTLRVLWRYVIVYQGTPMHTSRANYVSACGLNHPQLLWDDEHHRAEFI